MRIATGRWTDGRWDAPGWADLDAPETLVFAFAGSKLLDRPAPLDELRAAFPRSLLFGCSTAGEIFGSRILDDALVVAAVRFERSTIRAASAPIETAAASEPAGRALAEALLRPGLRAVLVLAAGAEVNGSALVRGLLAGLPAEIPVSGGLAGDGPRFERTWVLEAGRPAAARATAVGLYGGVEVRRGSRGGWDIFGPERIVTRSEGNVLYELDGRPALQLYKEYLGERAAELPSAALRFPLALRPPDSDAAPVVRTILGVDEARQSMRFAGDVPQGFRAQLMRANFDRLVEGAAAAARLTRGAAASDGPLLALAISCVGRRLVLGGRAEEEVEATLESFPEGAVQLGFYSYGEIAPSGLVGCELHNQTMTLTTIRED